YMPVISIKMYEGRTQAQKDEISQTFTREISRILKGDHGPVTVEFNEIPRPEADSKQTPTA
ncbi:tautomerase family protein, partial [Acetonema longum]